MRDWLALPRMLAVTLLVAMTVATRPAHAQMINTGGLFISTDEVVMVDDDFIQADATQSTINQGTLMISGTLRFIDGVIDETGGALVNRLTGQGGVRLSQPDFHTLFLASAQSQDASAVLTTAARMLSSTVPFGGLAAVSLSFQPAITAAVRSIADWWD